MSLVQPSETSVATNPEAVNRAAAAVARAVESLGLVAHKRFEEIARESVSSVETDNIVVGLFTTGTQHDAWIEVRSVAEKRSGNFFVMIEDRESPFSSGLTRAVEAAILSALEEEFPFGEISTQERVVGPSLGP